MTFTDRDPPSAYAAPGYENIITELENVPASAILADGTTDVRLVTYGDQSFVVRRPGEEIDRTDPHALLRSRAQALRRGLGVALLEQMVAFSPEQETIVTNYVNLPTLDKLPTAAVLQIEGDHYTALLHTIEEMQARGLHPDYGHADNCLFGPEGFVLLDYFPFDPETPWSYHDASTAFLLFLAATIDEVCLSPDREYKQAWLQAFNKGLAVLKEHYPHALDNMAPGLSWLKRMLLSAGELLGEGSEHLSTDF